VEWRLKGEEVRVAEIIEDPYTPSLEERIYLQQLWLLTAITEYIERLLGSNTYVCKYRLSISSPF